MQLALSTYQNRGNFYISSKKSVSYSCSSLELTNHLNNVLSVISDKVIPHPSGGSVAYYKADILQSQDFSGFGVKLKNRVFNKTGNTELYRSGFQGQEEDDELKGEGNSVNYSFRMHDPRLGRFLSLDGLSRKYPWNSPYCFSENKVINSIELEGLESFEVIVVQSSVDPHLSIVSVRKTSETTTNSMPLEINYIYKDASLQVTKTLTQDHFVVGSAEEFTMNREYKGSGTNEIKAMNVTMLKTNPSTGVTSVTTIKQADGISDVRNVMANGNKSDLVGQVCFQYDLKIYFKPNKAEVNQQELENGTYQQTMNDLAQFNTTMGTPIPVSFYQGGGTTNFDLTKKAMVVNGETDSQVSNPPFPSVNNLPAGNASLGQKRAENLLQILSTGHPNNNSTGVINHTGTVKKQDRNASIFLF